MNIKNYTSFFHDGSIINVNHSGNKTIVFMESAEMDEEDIMDDVILSKKKTIKGKLYIEGIKNIKENGALHSNIFRMKYEDAEIFHFEFNQNKVEFQIIWNSLPPTTDIKDFSTVEIEAEKIWWENCPNSHDFGS